MKTSNLYEDFLIFERTIFGNDLPIPKYDPFLIRYGEYRYVAEHLPAHSDQLVLDVGCESNIFILFLAYKGMKTLGVDMNDGVWRHLKKKKKRVERITKTKLDVNFKAQDATRMTLEPESVDNVVAVSSVEHMYSDDGHGDQMAVEGMANALKPGGVAIITVPMSNGNPFHESRHGDARFGGPYRLYTPETIEERYLSNSKFETVDFSCLTQTTPDPYFTDMHFFTFWTETLSRTERLKWAWANAIFSEIFNPITPYTACADEPEIMNTALITLRKK